MCSEEQHQRRGCKSESWQSLLFHWLIVFSLVRFILAKKNFSAQGTSSTRAEKKRIFFGNRDQRVYLPGICVREGRVNAKKAVRAGTRHKIYSSL